MLKCHQLLTVLWGDNYLLKHSVHLSKLKPQLSQVSILMKADEIIFSILFHITHRPLHQVLNETWTSFFATFRFNPPRRQPDNREQVQQGGEEEACMAVLNNFYGDGIKWHDVACHHEKPIVCEDTEGHLNFARRTFPNIRIPWTECKNFQTATSNSSFKTIIGVRLLLISIGLLFILFIFVSSLSIIIKSIPPFSQYSWILPSFFDYLPLNTALLEWQRHILAFLFTQRQVHDQSVLLFFSKGDFLYLSQVSLRAENILLWSKFT